MCWASIHENQISGKLILSSLLNNVVPIGTKYNPIIEGNSKGEKCFWVEFSITCYLWFSYCSILGKLAGIVLCILLFSIICSRVRIIIYT